MPTPGLKLVRKARSTGTTILLYYKTHETDPDIPWETVCDDHGSIVCHPTRSLAVSWMAEPQGWCDDCRAKSNLDPSS